MYRVSVLFSVSTLTIAIFSASVSCAEDKAAAREANCLAKNTRAEQRVCLDKDLSQRHALLNELYQELRGKLRPSDAEGLGQDQRAWQRERNGCGAKTHCLVEKYTDRTAELEQMLENLAFPNKSHVEIGCGAGQQFIDGECLQNVAMGDQPSSENGMQWMVNRFSEGTDDGPTTTILTYGIPETDATVFQATCSKGSGGSAPSALIAYDTSGFREGQNVVLSVSTASDTLSLPGKIYGTELEVGISGVQLGTDINHAFWNALSSGSSLNYQAAGKERASLRLAGGIKTIRRFVSDCRKILAAATPQIQIGESEMTDSELEEDVLEPELSQPEMSEPREGSLSASTSGGQAAARLSCENFGTIKPKESKTPVTVEFVNKSDGYRAVMVINSEGMPVERSGLNQGDSVTQRTYLTHPWMFTDGPGNCIEMFMPQEGLSRFEITVSSPAFGPEND